MTSQEKQLFELLDNYARAHHRCFLAEMFLGKNGVEYVLCFRPARTDYPDRYSCRYLRVELADARSASKMKALGAEVRQRLDDELQLLNRRSSDA